MINDHDHRFLESIIGWEMSGRPTSFYTRSPKVGVSILNGWKSDMESYMIMFVVNQDLQQETQINVLAENKLIMSKQIFLVMSILAYSVKKTSCIKITMVQSNSASHYVPWIRPSKSDVDFSWPWSLDHQPWPQEMLNRFNFSLSLVWCVKRPFVDTMWKRLMKGPRWPKHRMMVERYPNLKEKIGSSIPGCKISSVLDRLPSWSSNASCALALTCRPPMSRKKDKKRGLMKPMFTINVQGDFWAQPVNILMFPSPTTYMLRDFGSPLFNLVYIS